MRCSTPLLCLQLMYTKVLIFFSSHLPSKDHIAHLHRIYIYITSPTITVNYQATPYHYTKMLTSIIVLLASNTAVRAAVLPRSEAQIPGQAMPSAQIEYVYITEYSTVYMQPSQTALPAAPSSAQNGIPIPSFSLNITTSTPPGSIRIIPTGSSGLLVPNISASASNKIVPSSTSYLRYGSGVPGPAPSFFRGILDPFFVIRPHSSSAALPVRSTARACPAPSSGSKGGSTPMSTLLSAKMTATAVTSTPALVVVPITTNLPNRVAKIDSRNDGKKIEHGSWTKYSHDVEPLNDGEFGAIILTHNKNTVVRDRLREVAAAAADAVPVSCPEVRTYTSNAVSTSKMIVTKTSKSTSSTPTPTPTPTSTSKPTPTIMTTTRKPDAPPAPPQKTPDVHTSIQSADPRCPYPYPRIYCGKPRTILVTMSKA